MKDEPPAFELTLLSLISDVSTRRPCTHVRFVERASLTLMNSNIISVFTLEKEGEPSNIYKQPKSLKVSVSPKEGC